MTDNVKPVSVAVDIDKLAAALSKFQGEVLNAHKDKQGYNYSYADLANVLDTVRPIMAKNGLSVSQMPVAASDNKIALKTILLHESGQYIESIYELPIAGGAKMSVAQAAGSTITYMRRYALAAVLGIAQDDDDAALQLSDRAAQAESGDVLGRIQRAQSADEVSAIMDDLDESVKKKVRAVAAAKFKSLQGVK